MKRRTNLFYTSGPDSKFLTFSNYTEALTGNIISTDTKLFPSKFLCLKINGLNVNTKGIFIDFLMRYYENKLATIKDNLIKENKIVENLYPLSYLLEAICYATEFSDNELNLKIESDEENDPFSINEDKMKFNSNIISYVGDISEEDYNGTYTDIICCIDMNKYNVGQLKENDNFDSLVTINDDSDKDDMSSIIRYLHGWKNFNQEFNGSYVNNLRPIFDNNPDYYLVNKIKKVELTELIDESKLEFNIIIPLFDIVDINYNTNNTQIAESNELEITTAAKCNLPLGIWIYADKAEDTFITLEKDAETGMYPSWSLLISSQFKPFPYSNKIVNNANSSMLGNSFSTFSEVLTRMNSILDKFNKLEGKITTLNDKIDVIESKISNIGTEYEIENLKMKIESYKNETNGDIKDLENKILSYISNLKWSSVG